MHKKPNLKDYNSWFKHKTFTGKIHNTDFSKPMASYDYSNNVSQNGTQGFEKKLSLAKYWEDRGGRIKIGENQ